MDIKTFRMSAYAFGIEGSESIGIGDFVYALGFMRIVHKVQNIKVRLYLYDKVYFMMKDILNEIEWIESVIPDTTYLKNIGNINIDYSLDILLYRNLYKTPINKPVIRFFLDYYGIDPKDYYGQPWLYFLPDVRIEQSYNLINVTKRYRCGYSWKDFLYNYNDKLPLYFVGNDSEYEYIKTLDVTNKIVTKLDTESMMDLYNVIYNCKTIFCNQSLCFAFAQSIGIKSFLELDFWNSKFKYNPSIENYLN